MSDDVFFNPYFGVTLALLILVLWAWNELGL